MSATRRRPRAPEVALLWLAAGIVVTAPLWLTLGVPGLVLGLLGPPGMLVFKPGQGMPGKLALVAVVMLPVAAGVVAAARRWAGLDWKRRVSWVLGLSGAWHAPAAVLWLLIATGLN